MALKVSPVITNEIDQSEQLLGGAVPLGEPGEAGAERGDRAVDRQAELIVMGDPHAAVEFVAHCEIPFVVEGFMRVPCKWQSAVARANESLDR